MVIATKQVAAGLLVAGVATIWVPQFLGIDPLSGLRKKDSQASVPRAMPTSTTAPAVEHGEPGIPGEPGDPDVPGAEGGAAGDAGELSALEEVVNFLEGQQWKEGPSQDPVQRPAEPAVDPTPVIPPAGTQSDPATDYRLEVSPEQRVQEFLFANPLNAILEGKGQATAMFGLQRVTEGDSLVGGIVTVRAIDIQGVELSGPHGSLYVSLPPPGAPTSAPRSVAPNPSQQN